MQNGKVMLFDMICKDLNKIIKDSIHVQQFVYQAKDRSSSTFYDCFIDDQLCPKCAHYVEANRT